MNEMKSHTISFWMFLDKTADFTNFIVFNRYKLNKLIFGLQIKPDDPTTPTGFKVVVTMYSSADAAIETTFTDIFAFNNNYFFSISVF